MNNKSKHRRVHCCACATCQAHPYGQVAAEHKAINRVLANLDEKNRRRFVGLLALQWGRRHIRLISQITGLSRMTIYRGQREIERSDLKVRGRVRAPGAGRLAVEKNNPRLLLR
jgi:hypothetical protein